MCVLFLYGSKNLLNTENCKNFDYEMNILKCKGKNNIQFQHYGKLLV